MFSLPIALAVAIIVTATRPVHRPRNTKHTGGANCGISPPTFSDGSLGGVAAGRGSTRTHGKKICQGKNANARIMRGRTPTQAADANRAQNTRTGEERRSAAKSGAESEESNASAN